MEHPIHTLADGAASPALTSRLDAGIAAWAQLARKIAEPGLVAAVEAAGSGGLSGAPLVEPARAVLAATRGRWRPRRCCGCGSGASRGRSFTGC